MVCYHLGQVTMYRDFVNVRMYFYNRNPKVLTRQSSDQQQSTEFHWYALTVKLKSIFHLRTNGT